MRGRRWPPDLKAELLDLQESFRMRELTCRRRLWRGCERYGGGGSWGR